VATALVMALLVRLARRSLAHTMPGTLSSV
jgi:hypothetical protein